MEPIQEDEAMSGQTFKVLSSAAGCLLSDPPAQVDLAGHCDLDKMLTYRTGAESALISASVVDCRAPGSASDSGAPGNARPNATIEHVTKLSKDEVAALTRSLAQEWKAVLTAEQVSAEDIVTPQRHSQDPDGGYWPEERQRKLRRLVSEPTP